MHYSFKSTPTWTMKSRRETVTRANQGCSRPGPSDYKVKKPLPQSATISQTRQQRNLYKPIQSYPGPGSYESKSHLHDGPKRSMSARYVDYTKKTPGPHQYDNNTLKVKNKSPGYTMSTKSKSYKELEFDKNGFKPAPSSYESKGAFERKNGIFIGASKRQDLTETQKTPAPNYYNAEKADMYASTLNPRCKVGGEFRKTTDFMKVQETPGPAAYDKKNLFTDDKDKKKGYSCREKTADLIALQISKYPGPGQYNSNLNTKNKAPRPSTNQTARKTFMDDTQSNKQQYPGPGNHDPGLKGTKYRSQSAFVFKRSERKPLDQNERTPGPVEYDKQRLKVLNKSPGFSVGKTVPKNQFLEVFNPENPGPGQYDPNLKLVKQSSKKYQAGKEKRPDFDKHRYSPGPGYYNLRGKEEGPTWKFSTESRVAFTDQKNEAKDGQHYDIPEKVVDPPKYMNVEKKVKYDNGKTNYSTMNTINRSPEKSKR